MKKLILALTIMFCTVGASASTVFSCSRFYDKAKPNVDDKVIKKVFKVIKDESNAYVCAETPEAYIAVAKDPYKGLAAMVVVENSITWGLTYMNDKVLYFSEDNYGFVRNTIPDVHAYFETRKSLIDFIKGGQQ